MVFRKGGILCNGTIKGESVTIKPRKKCLSNVNIESGIKSNKRVVYSSFYRDWDGNSLASLCSMCPDKGKVFLDARIDYTQERTIIPDAQIVIDGNGKTIRTINPTRESFCPTFLDAKNIARVEIRNLIIDGGWKDKSLFGGIDPNRWFIITQKVEDIVIENCKFLDLKTGFSNWREVEDALMLFKDFNRAVFKNNEILGCKAPEGPLFRHEPEDGDDIVILENNRFEFVSVSSNVNIYFCRFRINYNYFGFCRGSGVNAFGHDGQIYGNKLVGSYNSVGIDVSEYGEMNYTSKRIEIKDNTCGLCYGGFFAGYNVNDITIEDNYYDALKYDAKSFSFYDTPSQQRTPSNDRMLYLGGTLSNILVKNNTFIGGSALLCQWDDAQRNNIVIDGNTVKVTDNPVRSAISLNAVEGLTITKNRFMGTGKTVGAIGYPSFICSQPLPESSQRRFANVVIKGNEFTINTAADSCYVFAYTIYDKRKYHGLAELGDISITGNTCNIPANILLNTGDFSNKTNPIIELKDNEFHGGRVMGNVPSIITSMISTKCAGTLKRSCKVSHDIVIRDDKDYFYVICGGVTAKNKDLRVEKNGLIYDGEAVLQRIKIKE